MIEALVQPLLDHLNELGFDTGLGSPRAFDVDLPLVLGWAWHGPTGALALVAGADEEDDDAWRDLLFAASALRRHAADGAPPALGIPVVLALTSSDEQVRHLRELANELVRNYVLFTRVDLDIVDTRRLSDADADDLDRALASLLPRCRRAGRDGKSVGPELLAQLIAAIDQQLGACVDDLPPALREEGQKVALEISEQMQATLRAGDDEMTAVPVRCLALERFRGFENMTVALAPVTVVYGTNGTGKSSFVEALELAWAGVSQRLPSRDEVADYNDALRRHQGEAWHVNATFEHGDVGARSHVERDVVPNVLRRCVLTQDSVAHVARMGSADRLGWLLERTGLVTSDLRPAAEALRREAFDEVNAALAGLKLPPLGRVNSDSVKDVQAALRGDYLLSELPSLDRLEVAEASLDQHARAAGLVAEVRVRDASTESRLRSVLADLATETASIADQWSASERVALLSAEALALLDQVVSATERRREAIRSLLAALRTLTAPSDQSPPPKDDHDLPPGIARRWLAHVDSLEASVRDFEAAADDVPSTQWRTSLVGYAHALSEVVGRVPRRELEAAAASAPAAPANPMRFDVAPLLQAADLHGELAAPAVDVLDALDHLAAALDERALGLHDLANAVRRHPAAMLTPASASRLRTRLVRHFLVRALPNDRGPIERARKAVLEQALDGLLGVVVPELVHAMTRFEWYFGGLEITQERGVVWMHGMVPERPDVDIRLLLNSAESGVVGMAWFLALHLLQPQERRQVLVLDDPTAAFDQTNESAFVETLRVITRLTRPAQLVIATPDAGLATLMRDEMVTIDGWPGEHSIIRLRRGTSGECEVDGMRTSLLPRLTRTSRRTDSASIWAAQPKSTPPARCRARSRP